jgi:hypothetical protein
VALKAWKPGTAEPAAWQLVGTDAAGSGPQTGGPIGVRANADLQSAPGVYLPQTSHIKMQHLVVNKLA